MRPSVDELSAVNWDFPTSLPGVGTSLHWYPGTFPNALPATLIQAFTKPGATVFDPYAGIGTTGFEAVRQGRRAVLTDANPVASAVAALSCALVAAQRLAPLYVTAVLQELASTIDAEDKGRQSLLEMPLLDALDVGAASSQIHSLNTQIAALLDECVRGGPEVPSLLPWFNKRTLQELLSLHDALTRSERSPMLRLAGLVMISAVLRPSSSQTASWGHIADNVLPKELTYKSVYLQCRTWLAKVARVMREVDVRRSSGGSVETASVYRMNWLHEPHTRLEPLANTVDLMITSPPYASAIDYTLSQRLSHYLFGFSDEEVMSLVSAEIGARRKRFQPAPEEVWATELASSLELQLGLMKEEGVVCVILPHKESGRLLGAAAFETIMKERKWRQIWAGNRSIRQSRTRQSWTSIQKEALLIFAGRKF